MKEDTTTAHMQLPPVPGLWWDNWTLDRGRTTKRHIHLLCQQQLHVLLCLPQPSLEEEEDRSNWEDLHGSSEESDWSDLSSDL
jgi:hypothetical protein